MDDDLTPLRRGPLLAEAKPRRGGIGRTLHEYQPQHRGLLPAQAGYRCEMPDRPRLMRDGMACGAVPGIPCPQAPHPAHEFTLSKDQD